MISLNGVQETLLIPLAIKASETKRIKARIHDFKAVEINYGKVEFGYFKI
ncbi:hypothetical protein [Clostridium sp.]